MKLDHNSYIAILDTIREDANVPESIKVILKEVVDLIYDLQHDKFMLECELGDVDDAITGKETDWNSAKSAKRCNKILELYNNKQ